MKFSRLMKGRLRFYATAPGHFATDWVIENELRRLRSSYLTIPFGMYWRVRTGETVEDPADLLPRLTADPLTEEEARCAREFARLLPGTWKPGEQRAIALALADIFDGFFGGLIKIVERVRELTQEDPGCV